MTTSNSLVVGVNGNIGSNLFNRLQSNNTVVWGTTQRHAAVRENIFYLNLTDDPTTWHFPDISFDVAYLCAGLCRIALCEDDPQATSQVNVTGMSALARHLAKNGTFIVYLSTNQVFSGNEAFALPNSSYQPLNEYGRQKAQAEQLIKNDCQQNAIVRLTKVIEPNMALIKNWIDRFIQQQPIEAFHDMVLAPVSLRQVVDVLIKIGQKKQSGCYQISGSQDISYYDLAVYLAEKLHQPLSLVQSVSAIEKGMKKTFLPRFTTLDCSSTIDIGGQKPPHFSDVVHECFDIV